MGYLELGILVAVALAIGALLFRICMIVANSEPQPAEVDEDSEFHASMARWGYLHDRREGGAQ